MDPHHNLIDKLKRYPELRYSEGPGRVRVEAPEPNGFALELHSSHDCWMVYLGEAGFHETFTSADEVMNFIAWCYSGAARVREFWRGSSPQKAMLEAYEDDDWQEISLTGYFVFQFWIAQKESVFTNPKILLDLLSFCSDVFCSRRSSCIQRVARFRRSPEPPLTATPGA